jgi:hypothetical protein
VLALQSQTTPLEKQRIMLPHWRIVDGRITTSTYKKSTELPEIQLSSFQ